MYKIKLLNFEKKYLLEEMIKIFLQPEEYELVSDDAEEDEMTLVFNRENTEDKNVLKREIYDCLSEITGKKPEWGILTGIRPVKLCGEYYDKCKSREETVKHLEDFYYIDSCKAQQIMDMYLYQEEVMGKAPDNSCSIYIGIPFCPTRCVYCSFASNQVPDSEISRYLEALLKEVEFTGKRMKETGLVPETIYIGGGTPTTLTAEEMDILLTKVEECFDLGALKEFTVEAGRPDTITKEKLLVIKKHGIERISINPQSMKERTLELIGRKHSADDIRKAFADAKELGFKNINADIIAGLPEESTEDFVNTLHEVTDLEPENITVHCLAVKKASRLIDIDKNYHYKQADTVSEMLEASRKILADEGFVPYYLYRQKHMAGAYENTGYCVKGTECIYNMRIMDEHQTIIALGAGGISKMYYPKENRLERVPNVTNYEEYIKRIDEMLMRKDMNIFKEVQLNVN